MMQKPIIIVTAFLLLLPLTVFAKETDDDLSSPVDPAATAVSLAKNPVGVIGLDIDGIFRLFGAPNEVFSHRGEEPGYDDVVFFYENKSFYLFLFENRVWVVRFDERYHESFLGIAMGMDKTAVTKHLGVASRDLEDSVVYFIADSAYPVRLRCYFKNDKLIDAYLYRGDF